MASTALDRLTSAANLREVWKDYRPRAKGSAPGIDGVTPKQFNDNLKQQISRIRAEIKEGYTFSALRGIPIPKNESGKFRIICIPNIQDRVVQRALLRIIESRAKELHIDNEVSFGFVKDTQERKRGTAAARTAAIKHRQVRPWALKADITAFFDNINRDELLRSFRTAFRLRSLVPLVDAAVASEVDDRDPHIRRILADNGIKRGRGLRQGMPLSPLLSNFLLRDFDASITKAGYHMVRYADDLIILTSTQSECEAAEAYTRAELSKLGLALSQRKTEVKQPDESVEFLGMELCLKAGSSNYCLKISKEKRAKIRQQFTQFHDVDYAVKSGFNLPKLLKRLENMKAGYLTAYRAADNFTEFERQINQWSENCVNKIYNSMFGSESIAKLTAVQRQFLLLPQKH